MKRSNQAFLPLLAAMMLFSSAPRNTAQRLIPANASLDVQVPALPIPVSIGGRMHLAYELHVTNFTAVDLTITRIELLALADGRGRDDRLPVRIAQYEDGELAAQLAPIGGGAETSDTRFVGGGRRVVFFAWLTLAPGTRTPSGVQYRVSFDVHRPSGAEAGAVEGWTTVRRDRPVELDPPLRGDASDMASWYGYGAGVLAVADAIVAGVSDGLPEQLPRSAITYDNAAGNYVRLALGGQRFALYEHLQPGSVRVKFGDRVRRGDVVGRLGASGSVSSGPHLHFHISDGGSPLEGEGLPFVFKGFDALGAFDSLGAVGSGRPWAATGAPARRARELPM